MKSRAPLLALAAISVAALAHAWWLAPTLPERVASHFDFAGQPNGWSTRSGFLTSYFGVIALLFIVGAGSGLAFAKLPIGVINLPNRSYWLDPARRDTTVRWMRAWSQWLSATSIATMMFIWNEIARANQRATVELGAGFLYGVGAFLVLLAAMLLWMLVRFARVPR